MSARLKRLLALIVLTGCIISGIEKCYLKAAETAESPSAAKLLEQLKDEKIQVKMKSGEKVKGVLREVSDDSLRLQTKKGEMIDVAVSDIANIKMSGSVGSAIGGFFHGVLLGTGGVFTVMLISFIIANLG